MNPFLVALTLVLALLLPSRAVAEERPIPMVFSGTDAGRALKAFGLTAGIDIVYVAGKEKLPVTLNVVAASPEIGVRSIATAAGLVYRKVGKLYVVAAPETMRQALEPYGVRTVFPLSEGIPAEIATSLQEALPYATIRTFGDHLTLVGTPEDLTLAQEVLETLQTKAATQRPSADVFLLKKAVPSTIAPLLESLCPGLKVTPAQGEGPGGALALVGPAPVVAAALAMAERLDTDAGGDATTLKVYNLRYAGAPDVVNVLKKALPKIEAFAGPPPLIPKRAGFTPLTAALAGNTNPNGSLNSTLMAPNQPLNAPPSSGDERAKTLILRGRQADVDEALRLLAEIDRKPKQIMVEVHVVETSPTDDEAKGLTYDWTSFNFSEVPSGTSLSGAQSSTRPSGLGAFSRVPWNFNAILSAKVARKEAKILAKPSIRVIDSGEASVFIGDTLRARIVTGGALGAQNVDIQEFPIGIILLIAPHVNADGNITMHVNPVISTVTAIDAFNVPQTSSREAETTTIVKDGETVVLGGLIRDEDIRTMQEIPFLSKLPILGELFKNRTRNHRRSDILVSITPHIIPDEPESPR